MRKWFTKEYWNQPQLPELGWVIIWVLMILIGVGIHKLVEYVTRP